MSIRQRHLSRVMLKVLHAAVWCALLACVGYGQTSTDQADEILNQKVRSVIDFLKQGVYGPATQEQIAEAQAGQLVPILEARFVQSQDAEVKARVARALVEGREPQIPFGNGQPEEQEQRQPQGQEQRQQRTWLIDGLHPTLRDETAKDGAPGEHTALVWLGHSDSQETRPVPVEMTIPKCGQKRTDKCKGGAPCGWVMIYIPPIAKCAMDGAPGNENTKGWRETL